MTEKTRKIKLVYIANVRMPNERAHGIQIANTCEGVGKRGIDLTLVTSKFYDKRLLLSEHYDITQTFKHTKIFVFDIPWIPFRYFLRNFSFFFFVNVYLLTAYIKSFVAREKLVVYVRGEVILSLIPFTWFIPIFFETHQIRNYESLYRIALSRVRGIIVVTQGLKTKFVKEYKISQNKILVARDSVNLEKFKSSARNRELWIQHGIPKDKKIVLYSGSLAIEKGVHTLAGTAMFVPNDVQIVFLGGTESQVSAFKDKYGNVKNISILGRVNYIEVPKYIAAADVLVLPDLAEFTYSNLYTSPMKLFEYMASGRPILASRVPSLLEVLNENSAVFFESGNSESLAKGINSIINDDIQSNELGMRAQEIVSEFTWEKRAEAIISHIQNHLA
ncbi:MAG: glycosyltransferase [Candidatus Pacebacteria bacterium]|nr:glycosyltransferase [Candidatus Paceibacterota bacterium]MCF7856940.1 glycosyltransferase [Candidatus Paceibacterota bacterium]